MMKRRLICRSNEHKLITFCSQQLLQLVPWQNGGYLWGSHNGHLIHWFDCAKQARLYLIVTELHGGGFSPISFCAWLMLKKLHYQKLLVLSLGQYLHILIFHLQGWVSSVAFLKFTWGQRVWILIPAPLTSWAAQGASLLATTMLLFNPGSISSGSQCLSILSSNWEQHS